MSIERINQAIEDAQHRIVQAMGDLEDAKNMAEKLWDGDRTFSRIEAEWNNLNIIDNRLGAIKSGRS